MIDLDHVAVAVERWADAWPRLVGELGGKWMSGGRGPGFSPSQLGYSNGMRVEVLEPDLVERNDFLRRFLDRSGPGPHHLTFKVKDIEAVLAAAEQAGHRPVSVDLSDPEWKEAFLHPKQAAGVVVQLAQAAGDGWRTPPPDGFPEQTAAPASVAHVAHAVADLDASLRLFAGILGGAETDRGGDESAVWVDLAWPGPGRVRLLTPATPGGPVARWIGDLPGRLHHIAFTGVDPSTVAGAIELANGGWEIPPDDVLGTRLLLLPS